MTSDQWYAVKRDQKNKTVYLLCGGDRRMVDAVAKGMFRDPVVVKLTWMMMKVLTGCAIPGDTYMTSFCRGPVMLPLRDNHQIIIKVI